MKKKSRQIGKRIVVAAFLLVMVIVANKWEIPEVLAGASDIVIDNNSFEEALDTSKWSVPNEDVLVENSKIIFGAESNEDTRLITRNPVTVSDYHSELFRADYTMKFKKLPSGQQFFVAFGVANIESYNGEAGSLELIFENSNGLKVSLVAYDENEEEITLVKPQSTGASVGQNINISVNVTDDMQLFVKINGKTLYKQKAPIDLTGRLGFMQTGSCEVEISTLMIVSHAYDRPANANFIEDFEKNTMNVNVLKSMMYSSCGYYPSGIQVEDYNGNKVLMFRNVATGYIGTQYQYSNFEMSFDIPCMIKNGIVRDDGTIELIRDGGFVLSFGHETLDVNGPGYENAGGAILFTSEAVSTVRGEKIKYNLREKAYYNPDSNDGYSVKITVIDSKVNIYLKGLQEKQYEQIISYQVGNTTPLGHVHIWSYDKSSFAVDNIKMINLDEQANLLEVDYKEGFVTGAEDWVYEPAEAEYLKTEETQEGYDWTTLVFVAEVTIAVLILMICVIITKMRKKKRITRKEVE